MQTKIIQKIKAAPKNPGIYIFYKNQIPLYIGKASNLKNRLQNYLKIIDSKTETLHEEANKLKLIELRSNIEALIEESKLIKLLKPKLNILWRDDKNHFYVEITSEKFPQIFITHQPHYLRAKNHQPKADYIGPFTDGRSLKAVLRLLRRYFPYCTCKPHYRLCLNAQINNCPGYCCQIPHSSGTGADAQTKNWSPKSEGPTKKQIAEYQKNIRKIKNILTGKDKKFIRKLKDPYELLVLEKIWAHESHLESSLCPTPYDLRLNKVECYDNSHLSGKEAVGAMTAWKRLNNKWVPDQNSWRKFKIRGNYTEDDPRMMEEIITRRFNHPEWPYPDLIIIDGGITQLNAAQRAFRDLEPKSQKSLPAGKQVKPKIISFAKPQKLVYGMDLPGQENKPVPIANLPKELQQLIELAINQTHNFVQRYHRRIRQKQFFG